MVYVFMIGNECDRSVSIHFIVSILCLFRMKKILPEEYDIAPRSWVLPAEYSALCKYMSEHKTRRRRSTYIIKPPNASMGNGYENKCDK